MNKLSPARRAAVLTALVEGSSIRSTSRMTGVAKGTILRLLADAGTVAAEYTGCDPAEPAVPPCSVR